MFTASGFAGCGGEQLTRLDLRGVQRDNLVVVLSDASDRVLTVSPTIRPREPQSNRGLTVPEEAASLSILAWDDEQLDDAYPCYRALETAQLEVAPDGQMEARGSERIQRLRLEIPASFEIRSGAVAAGITLFSELPEAANPALRAQLKFRVQADTEALSLGFSDLVPVVLAGGLQQASGLAWIDDRRALLLSQRRLTLFEPATQQVLDSVALPGPDNSVYESFAMHQAEDELRIIAVGSGFGAIDDPRPDAYTASCSLIGDTLALVASGGGTAGGLRSVAFTSSTSFVAGGFPPTDSAPLNLQAGRWGDSALDRQVELQSLPRGDRMERIMTTPLGLLVSARQRLHYGPLRAIQAQVMNEGVFPERMRIYALAEHEGVSWAAGEFGSIWRRELDRFDPFVGAYVLPPRFAPCGLTVEAEVTIGRESIRDMHVDDTSMWLQFEHCAAPLVIDRATGCGSMVLGDSELSELAANEVIVSLDVASTGVLLLSDRANIWFAPRL